MHFAKPALGALVAAVVLAACGGSDGDKDPVDWSRPPWDQEPPSRNPDPPPSGQTLPPAPGGQTAVVLPTCGAGRAEVFDRIAPCANLPASRAASKLAAPRIASAPGLTPTVQLPPLPSAQAKSLPVAQKGQPLQIGLGRTVVQTASAEALRALLHWQPTASGGHVAALRFVSPGAFGLRLGVLVQGLPEGALLRAYDDSGQEVVQVTQAALEDMASRHAQDVEATEESIRTWWSPSFGAGNATLEVEIPAGADPGQVRLAVPRLSHQTLSLEQADGLYAKDGQIGEADGCHVNAVCSPDTDLESRAVARMVFLRGGGNGYLCSGTLLNDAANSATPYFLTANHCIDTQAAASSLETYWFFRSSSCNGTQPSAQRVRRTGGASLLYSVARTDTTLLRLDETPPPGVAYAGSYFGAPLIAGNNTLVGLHHPSGDLQRFSAGTLTGLSRCEFVGEDLYCSSATGDEAQHWRVRWQQGMTEGGSSGSALFVRLDGVRYVTGQLSGGSASCKNPQGTDDYGRFDRAWPNLKRWLHP